jgi:uncharacterized protein (DUF952 family)
LSENLFLTCFSLHGNTKNDIIGTKAKGKKVGNMLHHFIVLLSLAFIICQQACAEEPKKDTKQDVPKFLYKILTKKEWEESKNENIIKLSPQDKTFIHLSEQDQVPKTITKFYAEEPEVVVLKIDTKRLKGTLKKESNPGGTTEYYHLYDGYIPQKAVVKVSHVSITSKTGTLEKQEGQQQPSF